METFATGQLPEDYDVLAPDGSEIRFLSTVKGGSMVHCTLPPGGVSLAVTHQTVEEMWYFVGGVGEVWRKQGESEEIVPATPGAFLNIALGAHFQFRNTGKEPLCFIIATTPPWPGDDEAQRVSDYWTVKST